MKFIKTQNDDYINAKHIVSLYKGTYKNDGKRVYTVTAITSDNDSNTLAEFDTEAEAQEYLDKLVAKLNAEAST